MINSTQNTSFKSSKIIISPRSISDKYLSKMAKSGCSIDAPYTLRESKYLTKEGATDSITLCTTAILKAQDGKEFRFDHLDPDKNAWYPVRSQLEQAQQRLQAGKSSTPLEGFLFGANFGFSSSEDLAMNLLKYFQETGVRFSALLGQKYCSGSRVAHSLPKNEIRVSFPRCGEISNIKDLERNFDKTVIGDNEFQFGDNTKGSLIDRLFTFARGHGA